MSDPTETGHGPDVVDSPIVVRITNSPELLFRAVRAIEKHTAWRRWFAIFLLTGFPVLMILLALAQGSSLRSAIFTDAIWIVGFPIGWFLGMPLFQRWNVRRLYRATPMSHGEQLYTFDRAGVVIVAGLSRGSLQWSVFVRAVETSEAFLLFLNKHTGYYLPHSSFVSDEELARFRVLVAAMVSRASPGSGDTRRRS